MEPDFWLMRFGCTKAQWQKIGLCGLKGLSNALIRVFMDVLPLI